MIATREPVAQNCEPRKEFSSAGLGPAQGRAGCPPQTADGTPAQHKFPGRHRLSLKGETKIYLLSMPSRRGYETAEVGTCIREQ